MNKQQFNIIAAKVCRKESLREAARDVIFNDVSCYQAELKHGCVRNTVIRSVKLIQEHFEHCNNVVNAS